MSKKERAFLYKHVRTLRVPGTTLEKLQGETLKSEDYPFRQDHIEEFCKVVHSSLGDKEDYPRLVQTSLFHGRSFEVRMNDSGHVVWKDEYGNLFGTLTLKGNQLSSPSVEKDKSAPSGYVFMGAQDSDSVIRQFRASRILRANGVDTEIVLKVMEPSQLPIRGKLVSVEEFKKNLVRQVWRKNLPPPINEKEEKEKRVTRMDIPDLAEKLEGIKFYVTARSLLVNERLRDLTMGKDKELNKNFQKIIERVFPFVNLNESLTKTDPEQFNPKNQADVRRYFVQFLPKKIGINYGILHKLGLRHVYPHLANVSLTGAICDLDSVEGESLNLGDKPIDLEQINEDLDYLLFGNITHQHARGILPLITFFERMGFFQKKDQTKKEIIRNFFLGYIKGRGWEENVMENLYVIFQLIRDFDKPFEYQSYYLNLIYKETGCKYNFTSQKSLDEFMQDFIKANEKYWSKGLKREIKRGNFSSIIFRKFSNYILKSAKKDLAERGDQEGFIDIEEKYGKQKREFIEIFVPYAEEEKVINKLSLHIREGVSDDIESDEERGKILRKKLEEYFLEQYFLFRGWDTEILSIVEKWEDAIPSRRKKG